LNKQTISRYKNKKTKKQKNKKTKKQKNKKTKKTKKQKNKNTFVFVFNIMYIYRFVIYTRVFYKLTKKVYL